MAPNRQFVRPPTDRAVLASRPDARVDIVDDEDSVDGRAPESLRDEARPGSGENAAGFLQEKSGRGTGREG
jgi:hypothetical protein